MTHIMGKAQSRPTAGVASRRTRVLAALALFAVSAMLLAGTGHHWDADAQVSGSFWMEFDRDLYDGNQTARLFGSVGNARIDNPTVTIQVTNEITKNTFSEQVYVDRAGGFELVIPSLSDALYNATVTHESAGSISTTFTIGQPPPEAVLEEAPQEPVPETEDVPPPETEDAVPPAQETSPRAPMTEVETVLHCTAEGLNFIMSGFVLDGDVGPVCIILPTVLISLAVILPLWLFYRSLRSETQAEHEEAMPSGQDGQREPQPETGEKLPRVSTSGGTGAFPPQEAVRDQRQVAGTASRPWGCCSFQPEGGRWGISAENATIRPPHRLLFIVKTCGDRINAKAASLLPKRPHLAVPKAQDRASVRQVGKTGVAAKLEGKLVAFDTNICINYMRAKFLDDGEMSDKARDFFGKKQDAEMDPDIPDCIDVALKDGAVRLPWKTTTGVQWKNKLVYTIREKWRLMTSQNWKRPGFLRLFLRAIEVTRMVTLSWGTMMII